MSIDPSHGNNENVTQNVDPVSAQTTDGNTQTLTAAKTTASTLTGQELIKQLMPDDSMNEPLIQDRPDMEDERTGKKLRTHQAASDNATRRSTRGSAASKYNSEANDMDDQGALGNSQQQETSETAQSTPQLE